MATAELPPTSHLTFESKRELLALLARDLLTAKPGPLSVTDAIGEFVVYSIPPNARAIARAALHDATEEYRIELHRRATTVEDSLSFEEVLSLPIQPDGASDPRLSQYDSVIGDRANVLDLQR